MNQFRRLGRCARGEVITLQKAGAKAARGCIENNAGSGDSSANDNYIEFFAG
jgi:hypothetical protein